ncbi:hypothetical protein DIPPA_18328 [Diplonema papillatum]|nr:hypothetical protein DIPPA_18328 [Diplonema papillatum]
MLAPSNPPAAGKRLVPLEIRIDRPLIGKLGAALVAIDAGRNPQAPGPAQQPPKRLAPLLPAAAARRAARPTAAETVGIVRRLGAAEPGHSATAAAAGGGGGQPRRGGREKARRRVGAAALRVGGGPLPPESAGRRPPGGPGTAAPPTVAEAERAAGRLHGPAGLTLGVASSDSAGVLSLSPGPTSTVPDPPGLALGVASSSSAGVLSLSPGPTSTVPKDHGERVERQLPDALGSTVLSLSPGPTSTVPDPPGLALGVASSSSAGVLSLSPGPTSTVPKDHGERVERQLPDALGSTVLSLSPGPTSTVPDPPGLALGVASSSSAGVLSLSPGPMSTVQDPPGLTLGVASSNSAAVWSLFPVPKDHSERVERQLPDASGLTLGVASASSAGVLSLSLGPTSTVPDPPGLAFGVASSTSPAVLSLSPVSTSTVPRGHGGRSKRARPHRSAGRACAEQLLRAAGHGSDQGGLAAPARGSAGAVLLQGSAARLEAHRTLFRRLIGRLPKRSGRVLAAIGDEYDRHLSLLAATASFPRAPSHPRSRADVPAASPRKAPVCTSSHGTVGSARRKDDKRGCRQAPDCAPTSNQSCRQKHAGSGVRESATAGTLEGAKRENDKKGFRQAPDCVPTSNGCRQKHTGSRVRESATAGTLEEGQQTGGGGGDLLPSVPAAVACSSTGCDAMPLPSQEVVLLGARLGAERAARVCARCRADPSLPVDLGLDSSSSSSGSEPDTPGCGPRRGTAGALARRVQDLELMVRLFVECLQDKETEVAALRDRLDAAANADLLGALLENDAVLQQHIDAASGFEKKWQAAVQKQGALQDELQTLRDDVAFYEMELGRRTRAADD